MPRTSAGLGQHLVPRGGASVGGGQQHKRVEIPLYGPVMADGLASHRPGEFANR